MVLSIEAPTMHAMEPLDWNFQKVVLTEVCPGQYLIKSSLQIWLKWWN